MNVSIRKPRGTLVAPDDAEIAAIFIALQSVSQQATPIGSPTGGVGSRWRRAGRIYDAYERDASAARTRPSP